MNKQLSVDAKSLSRFRKEKFLLQKSEDEFRDLLIRPLFLRRNLEDGRDYCGPDEKGKDAVFVASDQLGLKNVYVVQTKKGKLNLASKNDANVIQAITQLKTALATPVCFTASKEKKFPSKVILCASGKINEHARHHIVEEVKDPRLEFMDSDDIIPTVDELFPEFWLGIDTNVLPYLKKIISNLEMDGDNLSIADLLPAGSTSSTATDKMFVQLQLHRTVLRSRKVKGQIIREPKFEEIPVTGLLSRKQALFAMFGEAGSGKSTTLRRLAYIIAKKSIKGDKEYQIPVIFRSVDLFSADERSVVELSHEITQRIARSHTACFSTDDLLYGRVTILVDALDELSSVESKILVLERLAEFHARYPLCKVIVTSRDHASVKTLVRIKQYEAFTLSPINYRQAESIIERVKDAKKLPEHVSEEILRRLQEVHGMTLNPLLVTVFAATTEYSRRDIPANITELFKKYTELMLGRWDATKGLSQQYQASLKDFVLRKVAYEMHRRQVTSMPLEDFKGVIEIELRKRSQRTEVPQLVDEIVNRSGLFRTVGNGVEFRHLLLQEFFAGRGIPRELLATYVSDEWWQRAIVFYFGENPDDSKGIEAIIASTDKKRPHEIFIASIAVGLALQACYLIETKDKTEILIWVLKNLAESKEPMLTASEKEAKAPILNFLYYYLFGRDSVACNFLDEQSDIIIDELEGNQDLNGEQREVARFWVIIGLIEAGLLHNAEVLLRGFHPKDSRLLLAVHLGCFIIQNLRVATKEQRKIAERISNNLNKAVQVYREQILREFKSEVLEVRGGAIESVELPAS